MTHCSHCGTQFTGAARFCSGCGAPAPSSSQIPTERAAGSPDRPREAGPPRPASHGGPVHPRSGEGRFPPGTVLAGRYRITGRIGRGGMGEVYRADDLTLGQPVALKFLPEELEGDPGRLRRLLEEVRIARRVSHPNVCRVHDIAESGGRRFIAMELVDGEDLAALLRRIGRFPEERGARIARQICAGLAAAHHQGIVHRDLKPANILIDGRGTVRITDFGLSALAEQAGEVEVQAGTPAYMAPEQLEGREVTRLSDLYALGLVLYEIFTGKPVRKVRSRAEAREALSSGPVPSPSEHVEGLDPAVERIILRCLEPEPAQRPASVLAVALALPGGDPLAAALEAGETPAPEVVAAAGEEGALRLRTAWLLLGAVVAGLVLSHFTRLEQNLLGRVPAPRPSEVLADRGREIAATFGRDLEVADRAFGWQPDREYLHWLEESDAPDRWQPLRKSRPAALRFWYRQAPEPFGEVKDWVIAWDDPPLTEPGMARVLLDPEGRLLSMEIVAPTFQESPPGGEEPDWGPLFEAAGLEDGSFVPVAPTLSPPLASDLRAAWEGEAGWLPGEKIRVEGATHRGAPVFFRVLFPWMEQSSGSAAPGPISLSDLIIILLVLPLLGAGILAFRNLRSGRADRRGALKLFIWVMVGHSVAWLLLGDHSLRFLDEWEMIKTGLGANLFFAGMVWLLYLALEPFVRRRSPEPLIAWNRITAGRLSDCRVGRDLLVGLAVAASWPLIHFAGTRTMAGLLGRPVLRPTLFDGSFLLGARKVAGVTLDTSLHSILGVMVMIFLITIFRVILRKDWLSGIIFSIALAAPFSFTTEQPLAIYPVIAATLALVFFLATRYGMVALAAAIFYDDIIRLGPVAGTLDSPSAGAEIFVSLLVAAIALWAFRIALGRRPALGPAPA